MSCWRSTSWTSSASTARVLRQRSPTSYRAFAADLGFASLQAIPISARFGDNVDASARRGCPGTRGRRCSSYLETVDVSRTAARAAVPLPGAMGQPPEPRLPRLLRHRRRRHGREGRQDRWRWDRASSPRVKEIVTFDGPVERAVTGDAVTLTFADEIDVARGDLLADAARARRIRRPVRRACHLDEARSRWCRAAPIWLKIGTRTVPATVTALKHRIEVDTRRPCRRPHARPQRDRLLQPVDRRSRSRSTPTGSAARPAGLS